MRVDINDITKALSMVSCQAAGEKTVPGVMLVINNDELRVCYSDGHKAFISKLDAISEEGDITGKIVVPYESIIKAIGSLQPSGSITVRDVKIGFTSNAATFEVTYELKVDKGEEVTYRNMGKNVQEVPYINVETTNDQKAKLLNRMDYDTIFNATTYDEWNRKELVDILTTTSKEKSRNIYFSPKSQLSFVVNTSYTCAIPFTKKELKDEDKNTLLADLKAAGTEESYTDELAKLERRCNNQTVLGSNVAKATADILNKLPDNDTYEKVFVHIKDGYLCIFTGDDKVGVYVEQAKGSRVHISSFDRFANMDYSKFQINFTREFLQNSIKHIVNSSKNEKIIFTFKDSETNPGFVELLIVSQNASASSNGTFSVLVDTYSSKDNANLSGTAFTVNIKAFADMLAQLKSDMIAMDISVEEAGQTCMRLAEVNIDKLRSKWGETRSRLGLADGVETPVEEKMAYRFATLDTCQYTMIQK